VRILVVNAGSSSLKLRLLGSDDALLDDRELPAPGGDFDPAAAARVVGEMEGADAVGHRIVHGGDRFTQAVGIDDEVDAYLRSLTDLAPLHQPPALTGMALIRRALPGVPSVACFDTAFHAGMPAGAATYAVPRDWRERFGARRFGFHGLSHAYASRRAAMLLKLSPERLRVVSCHLGAGASLAAVRDGASVDTTMGFTPLEGLVMATRSGSVDPGLLLWLQTSRGIQVAELVDALEHRSGLLALTGSADMREVLRAALAGEPAARLGLDVYIHRLRAGVAAMAAAMDGVDVLVFTGGVGENAAEVRAAAGAGLGFIGIAVDQERNGSIDKDGEIGVEGAATHTLVVHAREDLEIARQVRALLGA
jgi:acetate kinase